MSALSGRISDYEKEIGALNTSAASKSAEADTIRASQPAARTNSLQDALLSSVVQVLPGLLGYLAAGKEGGAIGLQSGLGAGQSYNKILDDRFDVTKQENKLAAGQLDKQAISLTGKGDKLETRKNMLEDWVGKNQVTNAQSNARVSQTTGSNNNVINALGQFLARGGEEDEDQVEGSTGATTPTGDMTTEEILYQTLQTASPEVIADLKTAKSAADLSKKLQSIRAGEKDIEGKGLSNEKLGFETDIKGAEAEEIARLRQQVADQKEIPMAGLGLKPTDTTPKDRKAVDTISDTISTGNQLFKRLIKYSQIVNDKNALGRMSAGNVNAIRGNIVEDIATLRSLRREGTRAPTADDRKTAERMVPDIAAFSDNVGEQFSALPVSIVAEMTDKIAGLASEERDNLQSVLKDRYNFEVSDISDAGQTQSDSFNKTKELPENYIENSEGQIMVLSDDGTKWVPYDG